MLSSRLWPCSRCLGRTARTAAKPFFQQRLQSTASTQSQIHAVSDALLTRARSIAADHARLTAQNNESYNIESAKKIGELTPILEALQAYEKAHSSLPELESLRASTDPELRELAELDLDETLSVLPALSSALKTSLVPPHPFASLPCFLELHPGAGGGEASLFAHDLLQMYTRYCTANSLPCQITELSYDTVSSGSATGITSATLEINTPGSYDIFRTEAGVHRVQRVPATESKGRTHTSAVSVLVLPLLPDTSAAENELNYSDPNSDYFIPITDVRSEVMRAQGAGGQHVNKTESAVRLTHIPSGIVVNMQDSRSQHSNRTKAWQLLRSKVAALKREQREEQIANERRKAMGGVGRTGREDKVRTYNWSQNRVTDHRSGKDGGLSDVIAGGKGLQTIMDSVREWVREMEVLGVVADMEGEKEKEKDEEGGKRARK